MTPEEKEKAEIRLKGQKVFQILLETSPKFLNGIRGLRNHHGVTNELIERFFLQAFANGYRAAIDEKPKPIFLDTPEDILPLLEKVATHGRVVVINLKPKDGE